MSKDEEINLSCDHSSDSKVSKNMTNEQNYLNNLQNKDFSSKTKKVDENLTREEIQEHLQPDMNMSKDEEIDLSSEDLSDNKISKIITDIQNVLDIEQEKDSDLMTENDDENLNRVEIEERINILMDITSFLLSLFCLAEMIVLYYITKTGNINIVIPITNTRWFINNELICNTKKMHLHQLTNQYFVLLSHYL